MLRFGYEPFRQSGLMRGMIGVGAFEDYQFSGQGVAIKAEENR